MAFWPSPLKISPGLRCKRLAFNPPCLHLTAMYDIVLSSIMHQATTLSLDYIMRGFKDGGPNNGIIKHALHATGGGYKNNPLNYHLPT